jgi:ribosomal protein S27E
MPNPVGDDAVGYSCFSCFARVGFIDCPACGFVQSIALRWQRAFTCGGCGAEVEMPQRRTYGVLPKAVAVAGVGHTHPRS